VDNDLLARSRARRALTPQRVRAVRIAARLSQSELAAALGVTEAAICRWEQGERIPRGEIADRYAALLAQLEADIGHG
jgi:transcriptional regulator with XRE-family HTH domain